MIGHVPVSPSYREVEFEGMLHASSSTKLLSLNPKNSTRNPAAASGAPASNSLVPPLPMMKRAASRSMDPIRYDAPPPPKIPAPKSDEMHSDSTASPSVKKSLFRLPPTPGSNRRSMIPAEYSTVEFETRMASYSDDEHNGEEYEMEDDKQRRRESSTDAWVDILVGSQSRRLGGQDAELADKKRGGNRADPEMASMEVAQVLAAVQNRSPSPSSVMERVDQDFGLDQHVEDLDIDEVDVVPRRSMETEESDAGGLAYDESSVGHEQLDGDGGVMTARQLARHQRRVGYFDLHPERRQGLTQSVADDPRVKLASDSDDEDADEDSQVHLPPDVRPLPVPPGAGTPPKPQTTLHEPAPLVPSKSTVSALNQSFEVKNANAAIPPPGPAAPVTPSKTAALIEMYRERERGAPTKPASPPQIIPLVIAPLAPSRLPVRAASLPKDTIPLPQPPLAAAASPSTPPKPTTPEPTLIDLPRINLEETGRNSPARYVHGAPLQNVVEEEEEE
jgi:hypothetical protein